MVTFSAGMPDAAQSPDPRSGHIFKIARRIALKVMDVFQ